MLEDRIRIIGRSSFDENALDEMAKEKLKELRRFYVDKIKPKEKKAAFARWMMLNNEEFSYLWILAQVWLYRYYEKLDRFEKKKKKWKTFLLSNRKDGGITEGQIEDARNYPIEDLIDTRVWVFANRKKAACPFHQETKPSFIIYPDNSWHCFGCQAHGNNAIDFIMQRDKIGFREAVRRLR